MGEGDPQLAWLFSAGIAGNCSGIPDHKKYRLFVIP